MNESRQTISKMFSNYFAIFLGYIVLGSKINNARGSNVTDSSNYSTIQAVASTTTMIMKASSVLSTISPTPTTTVPQATQTVGPTVPTVPPVPTVPTVPTGKPKPTPKTYKRTYGFIVTLENVPYTKDPMSFMKKYAKFLAEMKALFQNGSFPELWKLDPTTLQQELHSSDSGKTKTKFLAMFDAVPPQGSKEPEMYFRLKNFLKGSSYEYYVVPSSIKVEEKVEGGVVLGSWTLEGNAPTSCCGESVYQTRTCNQTGSGSCDGLHLNRTFPCHLMYPIKCGKVRKFTFNFTLGNAWKDGYKDSSSSEYKSLFTKLTTGEDSLLGEVIKIFKNSRTGYKEVDDTSLIITQDNGKVQVSFTVLFNEPPSNPEDPEALFRFKADSKLGNFEIDAKSIKIEESVPGYTFTPWTNKASECDACCGGELKQTRTCQSKMDSCPNAQLTRSIKCKHVCQEVKCGDSSMTVPYVLGILICILAPSFIW